MLTLANPLGLWALLGIPAVLAIHFLQRQAKVARISTLFLLEKTQRESASGRRFDRLMNSVPLWMQLIAVLLLTWLLAEPRYQKARSTQRVALVLDSSASMSVFRDELKTRLAEILPSLKGPAASLELSVLESVPGRDRIHTGESVEEFLAALDGWNPRDGVTDPSQSIRLARSIAGREGIVVFATDTPVDGLPFDARLLAVGENVGNVGITGVSIGKKEGAMVWTALVRNHSDQPARRSWHIEYPDGGRSEPAEIELDAGALVSIQAALPDGTDRARIVLSADRFTLDDTFPLVSPAPKSLALHSSTTPEFGKLAERMTRSLEAVTLTDDAAMADLALVSYDVLDPMFPQGDAIVFVQDSTAAGSYLKGGIVAEDHPLVKGLNWQSLLVRETIQLDRRPDDDVLLWQDTRPLIFLRRSEGDPGEPPVRQLCFNFDLRLSNAASQPAFIVCLHRFTESLRNSRVAGYRDNLETGQPVRLAAGTDTAESTAGPVVIERMDLTGNSVSREELPAASSVEIRAPLDPGFLRVRQDDTELLDAAVHFADPREADLRKCASAESLESDGSRAVERHTVEDHWWRVWVLILVTALLVSWYFSKERARDEPGSNRAAVAPGTPT